MTKEHILVSIFRMGFIAVIVLIIASILSLFLPVDAPEPTQAAAAEWLNTIAGGYLIGWINQIVLMLACSIILAGGAALIYPSAPMRATAVWILALIATTVFLIAKFLLFWAVPMSVKAIAAQNQGAGEAETVLMALGPDVAYGIIPALDSLGFIFYAVIGLILFLPLFRLSVSGKVASLALLAFSVSYLFFMAAALIDIFSESEFSALAYNSATLIVVFAVALAFPFRAGLNAISAIDKGAGDL
ncbi:MAG: hypothetical protein AAFX52_13940 [Pseudomonadota bacterium]